MPIPGRPGYRPLGRKRALVLFTLLAIAGIAFSLAGQHWVAVLVGTLLVAAWGSMSLPATFAVLGDSLRRGRRSIGFSLQSIAVRVPRVAAPVLGGGLLLTYGIITGFRVALGLTIILAVLAPFVQQGLYREQPLRAVTPAPGLRGEFRMMRPDLKRLLASDVLACVAEGIPAVLIVIYATTNLGASIALYGALRGLQMLVSILCYLPAGKLADRIGQAPFIALTFGFFAMFPLAFALYPFLLGWGGVAAFLTAASVLAGLREIGEPARKALIFDLVDQDRRGKGVGAYYLARGLWVAPAPLLGGALWLVSRSIVPARGPIAQSISAGAMYRRASTPGPRAHVGWGLRGDLAGDKPQENSGGHRSCRIEYRRALA